MTNKATSPPPTIDIEALGFDAGAHLLVKHALAGLPLGEVLRVTGHAPAWQVQLADWCRGQGHGLHWDDDTQPLDMRRWAQLRRGHAQAGRWRGATATGASDPRHPDAVRAEASPAWGLAARGARVEAGSPEFEFRLRDKQELWTDSAAELYAQAVDAQWNPDTAIDWDDAPEPHRRSRTPSSRS